MLFLNDFVPPALIFAIGYFDIAFLEGFFVIVIPIDKGVVFSKFDFFSKKSMFISYRKVEGQLLNAILIILISEALFHYFVEVLQFSPDLEVKLETFAGSGI